ncbi:choline-phosphate cytidylyltransferase ASCRUDRAFT_37303, partial [Ascoidea rubescens DSM 1968]
MSPRVSSSRRSAQSVANGTKSQLDQNAQFIDLSSTSSASSASSNHSNSSTALKNAVSDTIPDRTRSSRKRKYNQLIKGSHQDFTSDSRLNRSEPESELDHLRKLKEFRKKEIEYDSKIPEIYKKYRPKGFPLDLPDDIQTRKVRIYCDGIYDLFHLGHMNQLKQCKLMFPNVFLVVGVPSDEITWKNKGLTVLSDTQRCETLLHCKWVDQVIPNAPWELNTDFLLDHNIDFVAHDDLPYASANSDDVYKPIKELGKFLVSQRTEGISTSDIITKIIRDYDKYLMRNFARGATREELNVSWLKKNELEFKKHINDFKSYIKKSKSISNVSKDLYWEIREYL